MKVNKKRVRNMYRVLGLLMISSVFMHCSNADPETINLLTNHYPELYEAVFERDANALLTFTDSEEPRVAEQAWNALISTPMGDLEHLIDKVVESNTRSSWASLWFKEIGDEELEKLEQLFAADPELRTGIATVLGYQGDQGSLDLLLKADDHNRDIALAIGRLSSRLELTPELEQQIATLAFESEDPRTSQSYLYGFYRSLKDLDPETETLMLNLWDNYYPKDNGPVQYLVRILMKNHMDQVIYHWEMDDFEWMDTQMAIEIARGIARNELTQQSAIVLNALLDNRNANVRIEALKAIQARQDELEGQHDRAVLNKLGLIRGYEPALRLEALNSITNPEKYKDEVYELAGDTPYSQPKKYSIIKKFLTQDEYLDVLKSDLEKENRLNRFFALQELAAWWGELEEKPDSLVDDVRAITIDQMQSADRSMVFMMGALFRDEQIIMDSEYPLIEEMLNRFTLPEDVEVFQAMSSVLKERFEEEALDLIDSLAMKGNTALNRTLIAQEWDILQGDYYPTEFRKPDWKRLSKLGPNPVLVLQTDKGEIKIAMDVLAAPATISGMDSLIRERAYNNVPFHRVIPNFVIQGGDIETKDGFGGPEYVVPTEATPTHYYRGKMGIASAGRDTEGSQYFIMHDWMPHLNGLYTIVGEVYEGMDVVDRIVMGDVVKRAYWD